MNTNRDTAGKIRYRAGYKYQLAEDWWCQLTELAGNAARIDDPDGGRAWIELSQDGHLAISAGYAWDGPSGPTFDTAAFMRGSLVHDALYQLMRAGKLGQDLRKKADQILVDLCEQDGMCWLRRHWVYRAVRLCGAPSAEPQDPQVEVAP